MPLHLALAGASSAIAGLMPFFVAAFAADGLQTRRSGSVASSGSPAVPRAQPVGVVAAPGGWLAPVGGLAYLCPGVALTGAATIRPLSGALGSESRDRLPGLRRGPARRHDPGAAGPPVVEAWARLRPAHAWLNLIGFVSLITVHNPSALLSNRRRQPGSRRIRAPDAPPVFGLAPVRSSSRQATGSRSPCRRSDRRSGDPLALRYAGRVWAARGAGRRIQAGICSRSAAWFRDDVVRDRHGDTGSARRGVWPRAFSLGRGRHRWAARQGWIGLVFRLGDAPRSRRRPRRLCWRMRGSDTFSGRRQPCG